MKRLLDFFKSNMILVYWTLGYFIFLWAVLRFLFKFDMFSAHYWWRFFHATLHGFGGFVFGILMYSAIPIYIATALIIYRKKTAIITIPVPEKIKSIFSKIKDIFAKPAPKIEDKNNIKDTDTTSNEPEPTAPEYPPDMPPELYVPYIRTKQNMSLTGAVSVFNKQTDVMPDSETPTNENESFPIPNDFDISDTLPNSDTKSDAPFSDGGFPVFKDIDFDTPIKEPEKLSNTVTKYFTDNGTEYETYHDFIATEKYVIYDHNDDDFWIMDDDSWFASKRQRESPIPELLSLAKQNNLTPVLYLE